MFYWVDMTLESLFANRKTYFRRVPQPRPDFLIIKIDFDTENNESKYSYPVWLCIVCEMKGGGNKNFVYVFSRTMREGIIFFWAR